MEPELISLIPATFITLLGAGIPSLIWLFFFLKEDLHPEPKRIIALTFGAGAFVSVFILSIQYVLDSLMFGIPELLIFSVFSLALIEEIFKFLAAYWCVSRDRAFDEPVDAMIYMAAAALGFASVENLFIFAGSLSSIISLSIPEILDTFVLRFFGATLLHATSSALVGFYWAKGKILGKKWGNILFGIFIATTLHAAFNLLILRFQGENLFLYPGMFLILSIFLVLSDFEKLKTKYLKKQ